MHWPNSQDYNEAVQCPQLCFEDEELYSGSVALNNMGLPKAVSGNFATVYRFNCGNKSYAVKCFLRNVLGQHQRYSQLSQHMAVTHVPHMVGFEYMLKGIFIEETWFPIVKMEWVEGLPLDQFLRKNWSNKAQIDRASAQFTELVRGLQNVGMAHGDLQHGNVLVKPEAIQLVDYDGMFVPSMLGQGAAELGHANYQHPQRAEKDFGPALDNFAAWIIYYSLQFLKYDPALWQRHGGGDECLIFRKSDFAEPDSSRLLNELVRHPIPAVAQQAEKLRAILKCSLPAVPTFTADMQPSPAPMTAPPAAPAAKGLSGTLNRMVPVASHSPAHSLRSSAGTGTGAVLKYPSAEQYFQAVTVPGRAFVDESLQGSTLLQTFGKTGALLDVDTDAMRLENSAVKGRRNVVFRLVSADQKKHYAVKCFCQNQIDRQARYSAIKKHDKVASGLYFTQFLYLPAGVRVADEIFPILKMLWVRGETIDNYVRRNLQIGFLDAVEQLVSKLREMMRALAADGIAHGDLEPSNILVDQSGNLRLVDYDAMYVPSLADLQSCEIGHPAYQHPSRNLSNYGPYIDNYSALILDGILSCMSLSPAENLRNWDAFLQFVRTKVEPKRDPPPAKQKFLAQGSTMFQPPSLDAWRQDAPLYEDRLDLTMSKLARNIKEMQKRRLDLVPPLTVIHS